MVITRHKIGATFGLAGTVSLPGGTWTAKSSIETEDGSAVDDFFVSLIEFNEPAFDGSTHSIAITATAGRTANWPGDSVLKMDIAFTDQDGARIISPTIKIITERGITDES